jgi:ubiquinone/menaquinone biosynthesis C-methylase UbiE
MSSSSPDKYVLARTSSEYQRLAAQAVMWTPATQSALARAGLSSGMHVLDVGCGTGAVMRLMADAVGPTGRVVGLDSDAALGAEALAQLRSTGPDIFELFAGDFFANSPIEGHQFDLVVARLLMIHMPNPAAALSRLWKWVKPGGVLLVMDHDLTACRSLPKHAIAERAMSLMCDLFRALGKDVEIGTRMPTLFRQAEVGLPDGCDVWSFVQANEGGGGMVRAVLGGLRRASLEGNHVDAATLDEMDAELAGVAPDLFLVRGPDMVATWKRKAG